MEKKQKENHDGHRQRMFAKMTAQGDLYEYEILEILLFYVFKRRNTNDVAHNLLATFGGIKNILAAPVERLEQVEGVGKQTAQFLYAVGNCARASMKKGTETPMEGEYDADRLADFLRETYQDMPTEVLDFYMLDQQGNIFKRRRFFGNESRVSVEPFELSQMILENAPRGLIAVHNHPQGTLMPSQLDDEMTRVCQIICSSHGVLFCDHVIVANGGTHSYYSSGEMQRISKEYSLRRLKEGFVDRQVRYEDEEKENLNIFTKELEKFTIKIDGDRYVGVIEE